MNKWIFLPKKNINCVWNLFTKNIYFALRQWYVIRENKIINETLNKRFMCKPLLGSSSAEQDNRGRSNDLWDYHVIEVRSRDLFMNEILYAEKYYSPL